MDKQPYATANGAPPVGIGSHLLQTTQESFLLPPAARQPSRGSAAKQSEPLNTKVVVNKKELLIGTESPLRLKRRDIDVREQAATAGRVQPILHSLDKINVKPFNAAQPPSAHGSGSKINLQIGSEAPFLTTTKK